VSTQRTKVSTQSTPCDARVRRHLRHPLRISLTSECGWMAVHHCGVRRHGRGGTARRPHMAEAARRGDGTVVPVGDFWCGYEGPGAGVATTVCRVSSRTRVLASALRSKPRLTVSDSPPKPNTSLPSRHSHILHPQGAEVPASQGHQRLPAATATATAVGTAPCSEGLGTSGTSRP
jgi:hypothetical protein